MIRSICSLANQPGLYSGEFAAAEPCFCSLSCSAVDLCRWQSPCRLTESANERIGMPVGPAMNARDFDIVAPRPVSVNPRRDVFLLGLELEVGGHGLACSHRDRH
jgi:hypothetical protein